MKKTVSYYKKKKYKKKKKSSTRKAKGKVILYHDDNLWGHQNVAYHRDKIGTYPEIKNILTERLNSDLTTKIIGQSPVNTLHPFLKDDIERVADKFTRNRNNKLQSHTTHKYKRKK